jgi:Na+-transporting methylmalonyl-CoA/oxaloacetate decarboxylase beta subunit
MQWILTYPIWTIFLVVILAAGLTYILYNNSNDKFEVNKAWIFLLALLRFSALALIGLLLLNPLMKYVKNEKVNPIILMLEDHSASIKEGMNAEDLLEYQTKSKSTSRKIIQ